MYRPDQNFDFDNLTDPERTFPLKIVHSQLQSPLFGVLPPEIRKMIFTFVLADYERTIISNDGKKLYFHHRIHEHVRRTDAELLRTCKRVFQETWFMPFAFAKHGLVDPYFYYVCSREPQLNFTGEDINLYLWRVRSFTESHQLEKYLPQMEEFQFFFGSEELLEVIGLDGATPEATVDMTNLQEFRPKVLTITVDYVKDAPNFIEARLITGVNISPAVKVIKMEFRGLKMNKFMLGFFAEFVAKNWFFRREDGVVFKPVTLERSFKYLACSEDSSKELSFWGTRVHFPGSYYSLLINTVTWKPTPGFDPFADGYECPDLDFEDYTFLAEFEDPPFGIEVL